MTRDSRNTRSDRAHSRTVLLQECDRRRHADLMAGTSRNLDREFLTGRVTTMKPLRPGYRAVLERGVDVIETDLLRDVGVVLYGGQPPAGAKARFFKIDR